MPLVNPRSLRRSGALFVVIRILIFEFVSDFEFRISCFDPKNYTQNAA